MSNTFPIPADKDDIAACTAMAGEMLGLQLIYMDAGSGALNPISTAMISNVRKHTTSPIVTGGGIKTPEKAIENCKAGADIIVVGNAIEKTADLIKEIGIAVRSFPC
jgi:putative glycerol-1-phosphate prenyltransferase